jgi:hypothetical protein
MAGRRRLLSEPGERTMGMPGKVASRLAAGLKKFKPILEAAQKKDVNESDTVIIVQDILHEVFGFDKYSEVTSEHAIRGTYCDLAIRLTGKIDILIEVKPIGVELKDAHLKQAVDYAANQGCDWVILTTGVRWRVYKVEFAKPISQELVLELNLLELNPRVACDLDSLGVLAKEGWPKGRLDEYAAARQARSRYSIAGVLMTPPVLDVIRRELRRITPGVRIEPDEVKKVLEEEVLKREVLDGDKAKAAHKLIARASGRVLRTTRTDDEEVQECPDPESNVEPKA